MLLMALWGAAPAAQAQSVDFNEPSLPPEAFFGNANGFTNDTANMANTADGGGFSGQPGDYGVIWSGSSVEKTTFRFFGIVMVDYDLISQGTRANITPGTSISFDARVIGSGHTGWAIKIETDGGNSDEIPVGTPLTTSWQTISVPLSSFTGTFDLATVRKIVILGDQATLDAAPDPIPIDIVVDNLQVTGSLVTPSELFTLPMIHDFNASTANNVGGDVNGFDSFTDSLNGSIGLTSGGAGQSGGAGDEALSVVQTYSGTPDFFGLAFGAGNTMDATGATLSFYARRGTASAYSTWAVRLEDDGTQEFLNSSVPFTLTDNWQQFTFPVSDFIGGAGNDVDLTKVLKVVFLDQGNRTDAEINLQVDDLVLEVPGSGGPSLPLVYDYNTNTSSTLPANTGGTQGFFGGGNPFFQDDTVIQNVLTLTTGNGGASGNSGDEALLLEIDITKSPDFTFWGFALNQAETFDITGATISFDAKLVNSGDFDQWFVRLEDAVPTGSGDFNNTSQPFTPTTSWQNFSYPVSIFAGGGQPVDLTQVNNIVFGSGDISGFADPVPVGLLLDNVVIEIAQQVGPTVDFCFEDGQLPGVFSLEGEYANPSVTDLTGDHSLSVGSGGVDNVLNIIGTTAIPSGNATTDSYLDLVWTLDGGSPVDITSYGTLEVTARLIPGDNSGATTVNFDDGVLPNEAFYGLGNPFQIDQERVMTITPDGGGSSGQSGDLAVSWVDSLTKGADFTFFGIVLADYTATGLDIAPVDVSTKTNLVFDAKIGSTANAFANWEMKLEDSATVDGQETEVAFGPLTTNWDTYTIPLTAFNSIDLSDVTKLVLVGDDTAFGAAPNPIPVDIQLDNIRFEPLSTPPSSVSFAGVRLEDNVGGFTASAGDEKELALTESFATYTFPLTGTGSLTDGVSESPDSANPGGNIADLNNITRIVLTTLGPDATTAGADFVSNIQIDCIELKLPPPNSARPTSWMLYN